MSKVNCKCGNQISDVSDPCRAKGRLVSDIALEANSECGCAIDVITHGIDVWECEECGGVAFGNHKDMGIVWYRPDDKPEKRLMERATK
jgi:hypothetical protein